MKKIATVQKIRTSPTSVMKVREIRARYKARLVKTSELTPNELDRIIHSVHRG